VHMPVRPPLMRQLRPTQHAPRTAVWYSPFFSPFGKETIPSSVPRYSSQRRRNYLSDDYNTSFLGWEATWRSPEQLIA
jgi:hypothetical protein